jgi:hypothetical protein
MNWIQAAELGHTLYTVGQVALVVGCPVAGLTGLAANLAIKMAVKAAAKEAVKAAGKAAGKSAGKWVCREALGTGLLAGTVATIAALAMMGGGGDGGSDPGSNSSPSLESMETISLVFQLIDNQPTILLETTEITKDEVEGKLRDLLENGKLQRVNCKNDLPSEYPNWELYINSLSRKLCRNSELKFVIE